MKACPRCEGEAYRAIIWGFPIWICHPTKECRTVWGFWSWPLLVLPFNGWIYVYNYRVISYPRALVRWLVGDTEDGGTQLEELDDEL